MTELTSQTQLGGVIGDTFEDEEIAVVYADGRYGWVEKLDWDEQVVTVMPVIPRRKTTYRLLIDGFFDTIVCGADGILYYPTVPSGGGGSGLQYSAIEVRNNTAPNINATTVWADIAIAGTSQEVNSGSFTISGNGVACNFPAQIIKATWNIGFTASGARPNPISRIAIGGVGQDIEGKTGYIRNSGGHNEASTHGSMLIAVTTNDIITVQTFREAGTTAATMNLGKSNLILERWF